MNSASRDVIIIGKGPAGLSAAIYLKRAGLNVTVIGKDFGALSGTEAVENYFGFPEPVEGDFLLRQGTAQAARLGAEILTEEVVGIRKELLFRVQTSENAYEAPAVLIATGKSRAGLKVRGFEEYSGKGVSFCAVCDGFFYRGKTLAVIGSGDYAAAEIEDLKNFTTDITLFTNGLPPETKKLPPDLPVVRDPVMEIKGDTQVRALVTSGGEFPADGIFVALGTASAADFAAKLGALTEKGTLLVNERFMTNVDGLFAAGDCIGGFLQIAKAVSDGAQASRFIIQYLKEKKAENL